MKIWITNALTADTLLAATLLAVTTSVCHAQPSPPCDGASAVAHDAAWRQVHPQRAELERRLDDQERRIRAAEQAGQLSAAQAESLRVDHREIRREICEMSGHVHGHLRPEELRMLQLQVNDVERQIP
jgi:uncharacterized protein YukE